MSEETKKKKSIEDRLVEYHPKFLEAIKEVYPLAVLGSLCIAIAAFTTQTYPDTQIYAITAASLFLMAFVVSFLFRIVKYYYIALISYVSTALAVTFLFIVVITFAQAIPMVSKSVSLIQDAVWVFVYLTVAYLCYKYRKRTKSYVSRLCFTIGIPLIIFVICYYAVGMLAKFMDFSIPVFIVDVNLWIMMVLTILLLTTIVIDHKDRKKKKNLSK